MIVIEKIIEKNKYLLNESEGYLLTEDYLHCDNKRFLEEVQRETGGYIQDCTKAGYGYYLIFSQIL